jgi:pimeloyl-ACP methyl ester carboxylesterase
VCGTSGDGAGSPSPAGGQTSAMPQLDDAAGVRTSYDDDGAGPPVVVLHGGLEDGSAWAFLAAALAPRHRVLRPDRRGHGRTPDVDGAYTYELMADETVAVLDQVVAGPADLVGYSDGGVVALLVALARPDLVRSMVLIGTDFHRDGLLPAVVEHLADPDPDNPALGPMRDAHAARSPDGAEHWATFHAKVSAMGVAGPTMTTDDLARIDRPVLVVVGDDDVVDHHHTVELFEHLPDAQLAVVPASSHLLPVEHPDEVVRLVQQFLDEDPPTRIMPMRTAG